MMDSAGVSGLSAKQIVNIIDGNNCDNGTKEKVVKVINEKCLQQLLLDDFKDIPIFVFSIVGKTRTGKSFLLNWIIKYLESRTDENENRPVFKWFTGIVPNYFPWTNGSIPLTRGLWIWPQIYKVKAADGSFVGILLLDNEGLFGNNGSDAGSITMSGISTAISYLQMMNVKDSITVDNLEHIMSYLKNGLESLEVNTDPKDEPHHKLMFVVRDWSDTTRFNHGLCSDYIEDEIRRSQEDSKLKWFQVKQTFPDIRVVLIPHPGLTVCETNFNGDLSLLETNFCSVTKTFIETLFQPSNLITDKSNLSGDELYKLIMTFNDKKADESLAFMNFTTDRINFMRVEGLIKEFELALEPQTHPLDAKRRMEEIMTKAEKKLMDGKSYQSHLEHLKSILTQNVNKLAKLHVLNKYNENIEKHGTNGHTSKWGELTNLLKHSVCGDETAIKETFHYIVRNASKTYYKKLREEKAESFKTFCKNKSLEELECSYIKDNFEVCEDFGVLAGDQNIVHPIWFMERENLKKEIDEEYLKRVKVLANEKEDWLKRVKRKQYEFFEASTILKSHINVNRINKKNKSLLKKKIGYALFGPPTPNKNEDSNLEGVIKKLFKSNKEDTLEYSDSQQNKINTIYEKVVKLSKSDSVLLSCIFVTYCIKEKDGGDKDINVPIFRVEDVKGNNFLLDSNGRVYDNRADFFVSNTLPSVTYCYPCNLIYDKNEGFEVGFAEAPSKKISSRLLDAADTTGNVASVAAGVAGIAAFVVSAPLVGGCAIIGGGIVGAYGFGRGCCKIYDKYKHSEKLELGDYCKVVANSLSVLSMGAGSVSEGILTSTTKLAQAMMALKAVIVICSSDGTTPLISLINEIVEFSLKVMFYFNCNSTEEALEIIENGLGIEKESNVQKTLETLLENNCVKSFEEVGSEIVMGKYVSQGVKDIVTSLLKTVDRKTVNIISQQLSIDQTFEKKQPFNIEPFKNLLKVLENENNYVKDKLVDCSRINEELTDNNFKALLSGSNLHLVLAARYFLCSVISKVWLTNHKFNNVNHKPLKLVGYDCDFHPLDEVVRQIANMIDQNQSFMELSKYDNGIDEVLHKLMGICSSSLTANEVSKYVKSFVNISKYILGIFDAKMESVHSSSYQQEASCHDLQIIWNNGNYGIKMLNEIVDKYLNDQNAPISNGEASNITILPAWNGLSDRLYIYYSDVKLTDKFCLVKELKDYREENYPKRQCREHLFIFEPCDETFPWFVIYAPLTHKIEGECGLIWHSEGRKN